jgi:hypothetical protein
MIFIPKNEYKWAMVNIMQALPISTGALLTTRKYFILYKSFSSS